MMQFAPNAVDFVDDATKETWREAFRKGMEAPEGGMDVFLPGLDEWATVHVPHLAPIVPVPFADRAGWCANCPLSVFAHPLIQAEGDRPGEYTKICSKSLLKRNFLDMKQFMRTCGHGYAQDEDAYLRLATELGLSGAIEVTE
jgi:hypothetical protein